MNNKEIKSAWKLAKILFISHTVLWILETAFFLVYEGWHITPTNEIEIYLDSVVGNGWNVSLTIFTFCGFFALFNLIKNKKTL